ncbi:hypothetical protein OW763_00580 [Clostridium aestuarii]|uniref:Uncharacterized protein n=1 Tax=Clostridium aestuarii TaxID=338193 RepID=A0ABT4CV45_9CLOT|nr:hypothetical protein [Clostridium aestuarii]MCY6482848.1 hypothetical protein [Clostridium aestuarii]
MNCGYLKVKVLISIFLTFVFFTFFTTVVLADDCSMGRTPDGVYPMNNEDVIMCSEDIYIDVQNGKTKCTFEFKNEGEAKEVLMGFPAQELYEGMVKQEQAIFSNFKTYIGEKEIPVKLEKATNEKRINENFEDGYTKWYTFKVNFKANETKIIKNSYDFVNPVNVVGWTYCGYILETGAYWKGNIGHARVYFNMGDIRFNNIINNGISNMESFKFDGNNLVYEQDDLEPDFNLSILYNNYSIKREGYNEAKKASEEYFKSVENIIKSKDKNKILQCYEKAVDEREGIKARYLLSALDEETVKNDKPEIVDINVKDNKNISYIVKDKFGDISKICLQVIDETNGEKVILEDNYDCRNDGILYENIRDILFALPEKSKYKIKVWVVDSLNQKAEKEIEYISN